MTRDNKTGQRNRAMGKEYFSECQSFDSLISNLESRDGKSLRQHKKDCRIAHSIDRRQRAIKRDRVARLGTCDHLKLAKNSKTDNRSFTVYQLKDITYSPIYNNIGGTPENEFTERFRKNRHILDKQNGKRCKN